MVFYYGKQCLPYDILLIIRCFLTRIDHKLSMAVWAGYIYFALMAGEAKRFFAILALSQNENLQLSSMQPAFQIPLALHVIY